jgi:hypothetical protein
MRPRRPHAVEMIQPNLFFTVQESDLKRRSQLAGNGRLYRSCVARRKPCDVRPPPGTSVRRHPSTRRDGLVTTGVLLIGTTLSWWDVRKETSCPSNSSRRSACPKRQAESRWDVLGCSRTRQERLRSNPLIVKRDQQTSPRADQVHPLRKPSREREGGFIADVPKPKTGQSTGRREKEGGQPRGYPRFGLGPWVGARSRFPPLPYPPPRPNSF